MAFSININGTNRPFPSSLLPLFQNESKCETFHMKMSSHFHKNCFALRLALKEAQGNSEMAYLFLPKRMIGRDVFRSSG